jgi:hypothetical protein
MACFQPCARPLPFLLFPGLKRLRLRMQRWIRQSKSSLTSLLTQRTLHPVIPRSFKEFLIFKVGCPEEWIKWLMDYRDLEVMMPLKETSERTKMIWTLLKGRALAQFDYHLSKQVCAEDIELPDHELLELVIRDLGLDYISRLAIRVQKYCMRRCLFMGPTTTVQQFVKRLNDLNRYLLYFPEEHPSQLKQDEIIEIFDQAKAPEWHEAMVSANIDILKMNYEEAIAYFIRLENLEKVVARMDRHQQ